MSGSSLLPRNLVILGVVLPLAACIGYLIATPQALTSIAVVGLILAVLCIPIFLRWHHPLLILTWNGTMNAFFLPGKPSVWMVIAGISFGITVLSCILNKEQKFQHVPTVTWSLVFLLVVVVVTAKITGGAGLRTFGGSQYGGKGYVFIIAAVIGYFALSALRISPGRAQLWATLFFLSGITYAISNIAYVGGPGFWFLFYVFPVQYALAQVAADYSIGDSIVRLSGLSFACVAVCNVLMLRYGMRGLLDLRRPWRLLLLLVATGASLLGGFRSTLAMIGLLFVIQFCVEGLYRTRLVLTVLLGTTLCFAALVPLSSRLPLAVQRVLSTVPFLEIDARAKAEAQVSLQWRLEMWRVLVPEVKHHFFVGKGYTINPTDLYLVEESLRRGLAKDYEGAIVAGDYHNGPLSIILPFGVFGVLAFLCVLASGGRALHRNWKYGAPSLYNINTFLFCFFMMKVIFYFFFFGAFYTDLPGFLGVIGFSVAVNGGVAQRAKAPAVSSIAGEVEPSGAEGSLVYGAAT